MMGYEEENGEQWERKTSIVLQCLLLWRIIREREDEYSVRVCVCVGEYNGEIWSYEWARWKVEGVQLNVLLFVVTNF